MKIRCDISRILRHKWIPFIAYSDYEVMEDVHSRQLGWRKKQVDLVKETIEYSKYTDARWNVQGLRTLPVTPNAADLSVSKRCFEGQIKAWRNSIRNTIMNGDGPFVYFFMHRAEAAEFSAQEKYPGLSVL